MDCQYCHKELVSPTAYEDGLYSIFGKFLCEYTCFDWFIFHPNFKPPIGKMYGMIYINNYVLSERKQELRQVGDDSNTAQFCLAFTEREEFDLDLHVFNEVGEPVQCLQSMEISQNARSGSDVLKDLNTRFMVSDYNQPLKDMGITVNSTSGISKKINEKNKVWHYWCESNHEVRSCRKTSFPVNGENLVYCVETCDGTPLCKVEFPECP